MHSRRVMPGAHPALHAKIQPREKSLQRGSSCHLLEVSRDLSGLSRELDFFLPRFIRLLSFRPVVPFFLTTGKERDIHMAFPAHSRTRSAVPAGCPAPKLPALPSCTQQHCGTHIPCRGQTCDSGTGCNSPQPREMMSEMAPVISVK